MKRKEPPLGAGKFLLKAPSEPPGVPIQVVLSSVERAWGGQNTNLAWQYAGDGRCLHPLPPPVDDELLTPIEDGDVDAVAEESSGGREEALLVVDLEKSR